MIMTESEMDEQLDMIENDFWEEQERAEDEYDAMMNCEDKEKKMSAYNVSIMIPISADVEANSFKEAIDKAFDKIVETANYGGDGIYVTNKDTGETYKE